MLKEGAETQSDFNPTSNNRPSTAASPHPQCRAPHAAPEPAALCPAEQLGTSFAPSSGKAHARRARTDSRSCSCTLGYLVVLQNLGCVLPAGCSAGAQPRLLYSALLLPSLPTPFLVALQARSSPGCFHPALTGLSAGFPSQFLASRIRDTALLVKP